MCPVNLPEDTGYLKAPLAELENYSLSPMLHTAPKDSLLMAEPEMWDM
jgi:hypothetical protein